MKSKGSKRGSMLIVAMFLLVFLLALGGGLLQWGMLNVDASVNARSAQQAYYAAKSALDSATAEMTEEAVLEKIDETLKAMGKNSVLNQIAFSQDAGLGVDVDENGKPLLTMKMMCTERPPDIEDGTQKFVVTATATCGGYSRSVSKAYEVTRVPPGGAPGLISTFVGAQVVPPASGESTVIMNTKVLGGTHIQTTSQITIGGTCTLGPPVNLYSPMLNFNGSGFYGTTGAPSSSATQSGPTHLNLGTIVYSGAPKTYFGDVLAEYTKFENPTMLASLRTASKSFVDKQGTYSAAGRDLGYVIAPKAVSSNILTDLANSPITQSGTIMTSGDIPKININTGGQTLDVFVVPQNASVTTLQMRGDIVCSGGGTVNFYIDVPNVRAEAALAIGGTKIKFGVTDSAGAPSGTNLNIVLRAANSSLILDNALLYASVIAPHANVTCRTDVAQTGILWGRTVDLYNTVINAEGADASSAVPGLICMAGGSQAGSVTATTGEYEDPKKYS